MFDITLYKFTKRLNSTSTPASGSLVPVDTYSCNFLNAQSIMNPVIVIEDTKGKEGDMLKYNYAYIPMLKRYYFISNTVIIDRDRYCYYLQADVLASFRNDIMNSRQYVIRSTSNYNDYIMDTMYPTVPLSDEQRFSMQYLASNTIQAFNGKTGYWEASDFFNQPYTSGSVIFGITGQGNVSVDYYVATVSNFKTFINDVVTATPTGYSWGNLPTGVQAALSNFMQYITFAKWIPFMPLEANMGSAVSSISLGSTSFNITAYKILAGQHQQSFRFALAIPDHPLLSTHGYYNLSPYREVNFFFLPIGNIPIDTTKIWGLSTLYVQFLVDLATGNTEFLISTENDDVTFLDHLLYNTVANIGIDLSLTDFSMSMEAALVAGVSSFISNAIAQIKPNEAIGGGSAVHTSSTGSTHGGHGGTFYTGGSITHTSSSGSTHGGHGGSFAGVAVNGAIAGTMISGMSAQDMPLVSNIAKSISETIGNALQPIGELAGTFSDFIASSFGQVTTSGHTGSFLMYMATMPVVYCWFYKHGAEDYQRFGRPYCETARLENLRGFCLCKDANITLNEGTLLDNAPMPLTPEIEAINNLLNTGIYIDHILGG